MAYFTNFPFVDYNFGNEIDPAVFQNLTVYVDLIDQVVEILICMKNFISKMEKDLMLYHMKYMEPLTTIGCFIYLMIS